MTKRILMLASNPAVSPVTEWSIGFWWAELSHAYEVFKDADHNVTIASPNGGEIHADGYSDPEDESDYSVEDTISLAFKRDPAKMAFLKNTPALADLDISDFDAILWWAGKARWKSLRSAMAI